MICDAMGGKQKKARKRRPPSKDGGRFLWDHLKNTDFMV